MGNNLFSVVLVAFSKQMYVNVYMFSYSMYKWTTFRMQCYETKSQLDHSEESLSCVCGRAQDSGLTEVQEQSQGFHSWYQDACLNSNVTYFSLSCIKSYIQGFLLLFLEELIKLMAMFWRLQFVVLLNYIYWQVFLLFCASHLSVWIA